MMTAIAERTGYSTTGERTRRRRIRLGIKRGRYDGGAKSWNSRVVAITIYLLVLELSKDRTALDLEWVSCSAHLYSNCRSVSIDAESEVESS